MLSSSQNPSTAGQSVTFTAAVSPQFSGTPSGTVIFQEGTTTLGTGTLSGGVVIYTTSSLAAGTHNITATYQGDSNFLSSISPAVTQAVMTAGTGVSTTTRFLSLPTMIYFRQRTPVVFSVQVTASNSSTPTGNVILLDGNTQVGNILPLDGSGIASYSLALNPPPLNSPLLHLGAHKLQAVYLGMNSFDGSEASQTVYASPRPSPH